LKPLSDNNVPEHLTGVTAATTLTYNHADRGVYIHITGADESWFYDVDREQFWPFDADTTASHVLLGPLRLSSPNYNGMIQTITGIMAAGSGTVNWAIVPGETAEEACDNGKAAITAALAGTDYSRYVYTDGSWGEGRAKIAWPRTRAAWCVLWLSASAAWAYESVVMEVVPFGRQR
jgi:hypothetical protein